MFVPTLRQIVVTAAACTVLALRAFAKQMHFTADLTAGAEVLPTNTEASGTADVSVDTDARIVSWTVEVEDLSGDTVAAHIHGPAAKDENAVPVIHMSDAIMDDSADITEDLIAALKDGKYHVNVHTMK